MNSAGIGAFGMELATIHECDLTICRISLPIGLLAAIITAFTVRTPSSTGSTRIPLKEKIISLDLGGSLLVLGEYIFFQAVRTLRLTSILRTGSITCLVLALEMGGVATPWSNWRVVTSLTASAVLLILFIVNEWLMGSRAMLQSHLLKRRPILINMVYQVFLAGLFFPLSYALPIQFQSVGNATASQSGLRLIPLLLGVSIFTMIANGILTFWRHYTPFLVVGAVGGTLGVVMMHTLDGNAGVRTWIGFESLTAIGVGLTLQVPMVGESFSKSYRFCWKSRLLIPLYYEP